MYAALVNVDLDMAHEVEGRKMLTEQIIPTVAAAPGFIAGYWLEPADSKGFAFVVFDTAENATAAAPPPGTDMGLNTTIASVEIREIIGHA